MPLWPQLEVILREYVIGVRVLQPEAVVSLVRDRCGGNDHGHPEAARPSRCGAGFLTPKIDPTTGRQCRKPSAEPMWEGRPIRTRIFSTYTVRCELGHGSDDMVNKVYSHLGDVRHRSEVVEYHVSQHLEALGDRLKGLGLALR